MTPGHGQRPPDEPKAGADPAAPGAGAGPATTPGQSQLAELLAAHGAYARPLRALVARLAEPVAVASGSGAAAPKGAVSDGAVSDSAVSDSAVSDGAVLDGRAVGRLTRAAGLPRRTVEEVLAALGDDVVDDPVVGPRIRPDRAAGYRALVDSGGLAVAASADPLAGQLAARADLVATMRELIAAAPRPRADLDHVAATAETAARRALWLAATYDLAGRHVLCVGDHDLTSLAAAAVIPGLRVTVVDVDDDLLDFLDAQARARGLAVHPYFADLRFGLPPAVAGGADIAFTDPPYTPEGVALFCARGAEGLRDRERGRVLLAYGFSARTPTLGWKTQRALLDAGFVIEAMLPAFHAYDGAEAVGARADHYVCRPTTHTWRHLERSTGPLAADLAIYTHGRSSLESVAKEMTEPAARALRDAAVGAARPLATATATVAAARPATAPAAATDAPAATGQLVFVGDAVPAGLAGGGTAARAAWPVTHVRLATVLAQGLPPAARARRPVAVAADLTDDPGGWLPRLLLAVNADALAAVVRADHPAMAAAVPGTPPPARAGGPRPGGPGPAR
ncbi:bis-aminopropyl spermidine synthase family protein, partial [Frankia nepalensis]|uniref:bis-aminopropyl spermidine synthase family protein n=1 Tax=Frankia nepalensis TaxID=1836974 RepID=UPI00288A333D